MLQAIRSLVTAARVLTRKNSGRERVEFKDASIFFDSASEVNTDDLKRWLEKSKTIQWDYKNVAKRRGVLERLN